MDFTLLFITLAAVLGYFLGKAKQSTIFGEKVLSTIVNRANFPVAVVEKIDGQYLLYEKDTTNFLCQAASFDKLADALYEARRVNMAVIYFPEEYQDKKFWVVNGKLLSR